MADVSNPAPATADRDARTLTLAHLMELDLDGPTLEILSAALTVDDCDHVESGAD
jgi:hypothetical protein